VVKILALRASDAITVFAGTRLGRFVYVSWQDNTSAAWTKHSLPDWNGVFDLLSPQIVDEVGRQVLVCRLGDRLVAALGRKLCFLQGLAKELLQALLAEVVAARRRECRRGWIHLAASEAFNGRHFGHLAWAGLIPLPRGQPPLLCRWICEVDV